MARWLIHDLRGPAQALTLLSGIVDEDPTQHQLPVAETLRTATDQATRSIELLDRLLIHDDAARPRPISLLDSLRFVASVYRVHHTPVALEIDSAGSDGLPAVLTVAHELEVVLLSLVLNSLRALHGRAGGRIVMTPARVDSGVQVTVSDDGPGISPDVEGRLFEPFVSGWSGRAAPGLGLAASRALLERHGGSLTHVPGEGPGATFVLRLPAVALQESLP